MKQVKKLMYRLATSIRDGWPIQSYTGCPKSLGHILTLNMSKTIKEITMHLIYSENLQSQVFYRMFKDVQCERR